MSESLGMPKSMKLFEGLYLCSLILVIVRMVLHREEGAFVGSEELEVLGLFVYMAIAWVIVLATVPFVFLASRKKSKVCKWILMLISGVFVFFSGGEGLLSLVVAVLFGAWCVERESVHVFVRWGLTIAGMAFIVYMSSLIISHDLRFSVVIFLQILVQWIAIMLLSTKSGKLWLSPNDGRGEKSE